jgi:hypothetical protein
VSRLHGRFSRSHCWAETCLLDVSTHARSASIVSRVMFDSS